MKKQVKQVKLFNPQWEALHAEDFIDFPGIIEKVYFGGEGCGKSKWLMWETILHCRNMPGNSWLYCRATFPELEGTTIPDFLREIPKDWIQDYNKREHKIVIKTKGEPSEIIFKSLDDVQKYASFNLGGVSVDQIESIPELLITRLFGRIRLARVPRRYFLGAGNPAGTWVRKRYYAPAQKITKCGSLIESKFKDPMTGENRTHRIFVINSSSLDNHFNPPDYVQTLFAKYPEAYVKRMVFGSWDAIEGTALTDLLKDVHFINAFKLPRTTEYWGAYDFGLRNPFCFLIFGRREDGKIFVVNEAYAKETGDREQLFMMAKACKDVGLDMNNLLIYADPEIWSRTRTAGKNIYQDLQEQWRIINPMGALQMVPGTNDEHAGVILVNRMFKDNSLFVFRETCPNTVRELPEIRWKPQTLQAMETGNAKEELVDKDNHSWDCFKYGLNNDKTLYGINYESAHEVTYEEFKTMDHWAPGYAALEDKFGTPVWENNKLDSITGWRDK